MDYKECNYCSEDKDLCEFRQRTDGTLYAYCLECEKFVKRRDREDSEEQKNVKNVKNLRILSVLETIRTDLRRLCAKIVKNH